MKISPSKDKDDMVKTIQAKEIEKIKETYLHNKEKTIQFLVDTLLDVDLTIPDVVIGRFAHKLMPTNQLTNSKK